MQAEQRVQDSRVPDSINARVIQACQEGDREAFRLLFEAYKDRVFSIARYSLGDEAAADDCNAAAFCEADYPHRSVSRRLGIQHLALSAGY